MKVTTMTKKRIIGLDILRIISMFGIVGLHFINQGGLIEKAYIYSVNYYVILLLLIFFLTSVDVFGMLSGYLGIEKEKNKNSRIIELVFIVCFYCFVIPTIYYITNPAKLSVGGILELIYNYFPILDGRYWYITNYVLLFFTMPYINKLCKSLEKRHYKNMLIVLFIFLSIIPNVLLQTVDLFYVNWGYSFIWLVYCYMIGGYAKLYIKEFELKKSVKYFVVVFLISSMINILIRNASFIIFHKIVKPTLLIDYISPFTIVLSIILLLIFRSININNAKIKKIIIYLSGASFSVYIIHCHRVIFINYLKDLFVPILNYNFLIVLIGIIFFIIMTYIICSLLDEIRKVIFKLLKINKLIDIIGKKIDLLLE